eukprot:2460474-Lingulodinium_polyedra.AAC.1
MEEPAAEAQSSEGDSPDEGEDPREAPLPPPIGTLVPIIGGEGTIVEGEEEGTVVQTAMLGATNWSGIPQA